MSSISSSTPDGVIKIVPSNIAELLTPTALAHWTMDDGTKGGYGFRFYMEAYSLQDIELQLYALQEIFGLKCSLQSRGVPHRKRIYVSASSFPLFRSIVSPFFHTHTGHRESGPSKKEGIPGDDSCYNCSRISLSFYTIV